MDKNFLEKALLKCVLMGMGMLLFWFVMILAAGDLAYKFHGGMFDITRHEFDLLNYYGLAAFKLCVFLFFVIPWLAVRLTGESRGASE